MKIVNTLSRIIILVILLAGSSCQNPGNKLPQWILLPGTSENQYSTGLFRKTFTFNPQDENKVFIRISASQIYRLYMNGNFILSGPQLSDPGFRKYDSLDISSWLVKGQNVLAVKVISFGEYSPASFFLSRPALFIHSVDVPQLNSGAGWKCVADSSVFPLKVMNGKDVRGGYLAGPGDSVVCAYSEGEWMKTGFDEKQWLKPVKAEAGELLNMPGPRSVKTLERKKEKIGEVRFNYLDENKPISPDGKFELNIKKGEKIKLLIDHNTLTTGFPQILFSGGREGRIKISYAESLYYPDGISDDPERRGKGNRNQVEGKEFVGYYDVIFPDGKVMQTFEPSWFRTFRYILLEAESPEEDLVIHDFFHVFSAYPFESKALFQSNDSLLDRIMETGWRTARLCAWDTYMDCPYYEQLQYAGDTRIQALVSLYMTGDSSLMRNAIMQFSVGADQKGMIPAAYPSRSSPLIPSFSLFWAMMVRDYWYHTAEPQFALNYLPGIRKILDWHLEYLDPETGMIKALPNWNFVDWPDEWAWDPVRNTGGIPAGAEGGISSIINLQFVWTIHEMLPLFRAAGMDEYAAGAEALAGRMLDSVRMHCWDENRGMPADSPEKKEFSQHAGILAVLAGMIDVEKQAEFIEKIALSDDLIQSTVYYRFYLNRALEKAGKSELWFSLLKPWTDMLDAGLTSFAEKNDPTRSDCHAWSAGPCYDVFSLICGIRPASESFTRIKIQPAPGKLEWIRAEMPHPRGIIRFHYVKGRYFDITIPAGCSGEFIFEGKSVMLLPGNQKIVI